MAMTLRVYVFSTFLLSILCTLLIIVSVSSENWVVSTATSQNQIQDSTVRYGLFVGEVVLNTLATPSASILRMTCISDAGACAVSCKTEAAAREAEVLALSQGFRPSTACVAVTEVSTENPLTDPPVISYSVYVVVLVFLFLMMAASVAAAGLSIVNATMNPTEPVFGLPGCLGVNVAVIILGLITIMTFGIYWASSGLNEHLAFSYISVGPFVANASLGYSYWLLLPAIFCSVANVCLLQIRAYLLEQDPPAPVIKVEANSDGTIFLY